MMVLKLPGSRRTLSVTPVKLLVAIALLIPALWALYLLADLWRTQASIYEDLPSQANAALTPQPRGTQPILIFPTPEPGGEEPRPAGTPAPAPTGTPRPMPTAAPGVPTSYDPAAVVPTVAARLPTLAAVDSSIGDWNGRKRITVLLLGVDQRGGEPTRSDTIILANLDFERNEARVLSVPRDLYVEIPYGFLWHKINAAYAIGENPERAALVGGGSGLMTATLRYNFGIDVIDEVAVVNFEGFVEGVDALGGIDLIVPRRLVDSRYPDGMRTITVVFEPGQQHMNGARALRYARIRHADSDFGRIQRQQEVILAVQQKASNPAIILKAPSLLSVLRDGALKTSLTLDEQVRLARWGASLPRDRITFYTLPGRIGANERGESVVWANRDQGDAILRAVFGPQAGLERYGDQSP